MLLSVKEYAENQGVSVQAVYKQIKNGSLKTQETEKGIKILIDEIIKPETINLNEVESIKKENEYLKTLLHQTVADKERWYKEFTEIKGELKEFKEVVKQLEYKTEENKNVYDEISGLKNRLKEQEEELIKEKSKTWIQKLFKK